MSSEKLSEILVTVGRLESALTVILAIVVITGVVMIVHMFLELGLLIYVLVNKKKDETQLDEIVVVKDDKLKAKKLIPEKKSSTHTEPMPKILIPEKKSSTHTEPMPKKQEKLSRSPPVKKRPKEKKKPKRSDTGRDKIRPTLPVDSVAVFVQQNHKRTNVDIEEPVASKPNVKRSRTSERSESTHPTTNRSSVQGPQFDSMH